MAYEIIWSPNAQGQLIEILHFYSNRNLTNLYSQKLYNIFIKSINQLSNHPEIGSKTDFPGLRSKLIKNYFIFYKIEKETIFILLIWDSRRDPQQLNRLLKKIS